MAAYVTLYCCPEGCIEIKCASKYKDSAIENFIQEDSYLIQNEAEVIKLDKNHDYFYQVQTKLLVTWFQYYDFFCLLDK